MTEETRGILGPTEPHPAAFSAKEYLGALGLQKLTMYLEAFSSCAIENNRLGEICSETLNRFLTGQPVSDRYLLGLAWSIRNMEEKDDLNDLADSLPEYLVQDDMKYYLSIEKSASPKGGWVMMYEVSPFDSDESKCLYLVEGKGLTDAVKGMLEIIDKHYTIIKE